MADHMRWCTLIVCRVEFQADLNTADSVIACVQNAATLSDCTRLMEVGVLL